ncbi:MAG: hypothetical protein KDB53_16905, partial [Planctomycetes bacterium]|nr:hypothetical protein [Planctomycetota bacterium]
MNGEAPTAVQEAVPLDQRAKNEQMRLRALSKRIAGAAAALGPLTKATSFQDLKKLEAVIKKIELKIPGDQVMGAGLVPFMGAVNAFVADAGERLRRRLGRELEAACRERQIPFRVVSREEPVELRLDPLSCILDFDRAQARLAFARNEI